LPEGGSDALTRCAATTKTLARRRERTQGVRGCGETPLLRRMLLTIKDLSAWLNIKPSTLYLWVTQGKIPCQKIHGLIRFDRDHVQRWLESFQDKPLVFVPSFSDKNRTDVDKLIEAAKRDAYTPRHGETISPSPMRKEEKDGAR